jgi:hypothetical protein
MHVIKQKNFLGLGVEEKGTTQKPPKISFLVIIESKFYNTNFVKLNNTHEDDNHVIKIEYS